MNINKTTLKLLIKEVLREARDENEEQDKELTWKKIIDNLEDEGFRLIVLKAVTNANRDDPEFLADMFETLTNEEDREVQQILINHVERIYKEGEL